MAAPRDWVIDDHRRLFGVAATKTWRAARSFFDQAEQLAAIRQDSACRAMRSAMKATGLSGEELSQRLGKNKAHVGRKLRGEEWLDWRELHEWALAVGDPAVITAGLGVEAPELGQLLGPADPPGTVFGLP